MGVLLTTAPVHHTFIACIPRSSIPTYRGERGFLLWEAVRILGVMVWAGIGKTHNCSAEDGKDNEDAHHDHLSVMGTM